MVDGTGFAMISGNVDTVVPGIYTIYYDYVDSS